MERKRQTEGRGGLGPRVSSLTKCWLIFAGILLQSVVSKDELRNRARLVNLINLVTKVDLG